jgi:hypothetical protein
MSLLLCRRFEYLTHLRGLFLSAGKAIFIGGPGVAVISYLVVGTILWSVDLHWIA